MALIDNPKAWILRLFEMEVREGRGAKCQIFQEGTTLLELPLRPDERIYGIYADKYYFSPQSFIMNTGTKYERIAWANIRNCSSHHGGGHKTAELTLTDGRIVKVRVGDFATGSSGRISQLFHQMIIKWGTRATLGPEPLSIEAFFAIANDDYCFAPNLEPHPTLNEFREVLTNLHKQEGVIDVLLRIIEIEDGIPISDGIIVRARHTTPESIFADFAKRWSADGVIDVSPEDIRALPVVEGVYSKLMVWD